MWSAIPWAAASFGGCMMDAPERLLSAVLVAPVSPYGFGGTKDAEGTLCAPDAAGSGGGVANPQYTQMLRRRRTRRRRDDAAPCDEQLLLEAALHIRTRRRPADIRAANAYWRARLPGRLRPRRRIGPPSRLVAGACSMAWRPIISPMRAGSTPSSPSRRLLWLRGDSDQVIADMSMFDLATFGKLGVVPGWPGDEVCPPQPMIAQTRQVLDRLCSGRRQRRRDRDRRLRSYALHRKSGRIQRGAACDFLARALIRSVINSCASEAACALYSSVARRNIKSYISSEDSSNDRRSAHVQTVTCLHCRFCCIIVFGSNQPGRRRMISPFSPPSAPTIPMSRRRTIPDPPKL